MKIKRRILDWTDYFTMFILIGCIGFGFQFAFLVNGMNPWISLIIPVVFSKIWYENTSQLK